MMCAHCCGLGTVVSGVDGLGRSTCIHCGGSGKDRFADVFNPPQRYGTSRNRPARAQKSPKQRVAKAPLTSAEIEDKIAALLAAIAGGGFFYQAAVAGKMNWLAAMGVGFAVYLFIDYLLTRHFRWLLVAARWGLQTTLTLIGWSVLIGIIGGIAYLIHASQK